ncbi:MAG: pseudouridine synthase, partial [Neisseria sp.]|nr:pseudouridine synthase [Neisseria sp.]
MLPIILQHADFVVINKPAGLAVHRDENESGLTEQLAAQLGVPRVWLVHRLDKATSGVLLLALNARAAAELGAAFAEKRVQKTYWALSDSKPAKKQGRIKGGMEKSRRGAWKLTRGNENLALTDFTTRSLAPKLRLFVLT